MCLSRDRTSSGLCKYAAQTWAAHLETVNQTTSNIFENTDVPASVEEFMSLVDSGQVKIERIVSHGQASPPGFWYDQDHDEWVLLLRGETTVELEQGSLIDLFAGSFLLIPRHARHRVNRTSRDAVWLAIHFPHTP